MKILFIVPYPEGEAPSQRFRFEHYYQTLKDAGCDIKVQPFLSSRAFKSLHSSRTLLEKGAFVLYGLLKRLLILRFLHKIDYVFIHREATPVGPAFIEWCLAKIFKKKIIYDFDDAIWLTDRTDESNLAARIRWRNKVNSICRWSYKISCGNLYLAEYAKQFNRNVFINPTTVDSSGTHVPKASGEKSNKNITIGWTGSRSTLKYLKTVVPVLKALEEKYPRLTFLIIADEDPDLQLKNVVFLPWNKHTEIDDLAAMDIGIMPLPDDEWTRGKCGFKALQYMSMGIPAVVSPVGVNREIVQNGSEGLWCTSPHEWFANLEMLILDPEKRKEMGELGRQKVIANYSVSSNVANFLSLFQ